MALVTLRAMEEGDLAAVAAVTNAAFAERFAIATDAEPIFRDALFECRLAADPEGCVVALDDLGEVTGALFSLARGSLGWFGPLAVRPGAQQAGTGAALVEARRDSCSSPPPRGLPSIACFAPVGPSAESGGTTRSSSGRAARAGRPLMPWPSAAFGRDKFSSA
ncbi:MAG: hypothetical protein ACRD0B_11705 [Acidimicrobiales bacterium]